MTTSSASAFGPSTSTDSPPPLTRSSPSRYNRETRSALSLRHEHRARRDLRDLLRARRGGDRSGAAPLPGLYGARQAGRAGRALRVAAAGDRARAPRRGARLRGRRALAGGRGAAQPRRAPADLRPLPGRPRERRAVRRGPPPGERLPRALRDHGGRQAEDLKADGLDRLLPGQHLDPIDAAGLVAEVQDERPVPLAVELGERAEAAKAGPRHVPRGLELQGPHLS